MPEYFTSALVLIALFTCFIGLVIWAWSKNRNDTFTHASNLPLENEEAYLQESTQSASTTASSHSEVNKG